MTSKPQRVKQIALKHRAPQNWMDEATERANISWLAQTVFSTSDPDMPFVVNEATKYSISGRGPCSEPYRFLPLVTMLPARYYVR
jgi:hypothetical protein